MSELWRSRFSVSLSWTEGLRVPAADAPKMTRAFEIGAFGERSGQRDAIGS
jgi:hypothetical protein